MSEKMTKKEQKELENKVKKFVNGINNPNTTMTNEKLAELKKNVYESASIIRQRLIMRHAFTGGMLMRFDIVPVRDYRIGTACTDGNKIYFDIDFYKNLTDDERQFVLAHECWHNIFLHFLRRQGRNPDIFNIATDCEINYMLSKEGLIAPEGLCFPESEDEGKSAEEIYEHLLKKMKQQKKQKGNSQKQENQNENSEDGEFSDDCDGRNKNRYNDNKGAKSKNKKLRGQFDKHINKDDDGVSENGVPTDEWGEKGIDSDFNPRISQDVAEKIREAVISEAQKVERSQGTLPSHLSSIVGQLRNPEIDWRTRLSQFVTACMGGVRRWVPPARHYVYQGIYLQSRRGEKINVVCTVDTSGSTTSDLPKFMTELVSLLNTFGNYSMTLVQCDAAVHSVETYDESNPFPIEDCSKIEWKGFGGSDLRPAFDEIYNRGIEASMHIVFTDGYITTPERNPLKCPTLFVLTRDGNEDLCNWGEKLKFKETV